MEEKKKEEVKTPDVSKSKSDFLGGKNFNFYLDLVKVPVIIVAVWKLFVFIIGKVPLLGWLFRLLVSPISWLIPLVAFFWVGWEAVKKHNLTILNSAVAGGIAGAGVGLVEFVLSLINGHFNPLFFVTLIWVIINRAIIGGVVALVAGLIAGGSTSSTTTKS